MPQQYLKLNEVTGQWEPTPPPKGGLPWWATVLAALAALIVGVGLGAAGASGKTANVSASGSTSTLEPVTTVTTQPTTTVAVATTSTLPPTTATTAAPTTTLPPTTKPPAPRKVATFTGTSDQNTASFVVGKTWRVDWNVKANTTPVVYVNSADGDRISRFDTGSGGTGSTIIREACTCYLEIKVFGDTTYTFTVTDLPGGA